MQELIVVVFKCISSTFYERITKVELHRSHMIVSFEKGSVTVKRKGRWYDVKGDSPLVSREEEILSDGLKNNVKFAYRVSKLLDIGKISDELLSVY